VKKDQASPGPGQAQHRTGRADGGHRL